MASPQGFLDSYDHGDCPAELALQVMRGRWKVQILRELAESTRRFSALRRSLEGVSEKVLASQLRELEQAGVVPSQPQASAKEWRRLAEAGPETAMLKELADGNV